MTTTALTETLIGVLVADLTLLIVPTFFRNRGTLYGVCSERFQCNQRLFLPTKASFGHFMQGLCGITLILIAQRMGPVLGRVTDNAWTVALYIIGALLIVIYPIYNLIKRLKKRKAAGLNNTSYANNVLDFLWGVWFASIVGTSVLISMFGALLPEESCAESVPILCVTIAVIFVVFIVTTKMTATQITDTTLCTTTAYTCK